MDAGRKHAKSFGKKEKILNYASNTYQLTRPTKVGKVMALIRECQPAALAEWEAYYFAKAESGRHGKITRETLDELGERLFAKITEVVIPEWTQAFSELTMQDCRDYIYEVTVVRTYDGFLLEKSIVNDVLGKAFPDVLFEESDAALDHAGDVDYLGRVGERAFGIQIKPVTAEAAIGYSITERMRENFAAFERVHGGRMFVVFSVREGNRKVIRNKEVIGEIAAEIERLRGGG